MWVYKQTEPGLYTVGYYAPDGKWNSDSDHGTKAEAGDRCAYLNGLKHSQSMSQALNEGDGSYRP